MIATAITLTLGLLLKVIEGTDISDTFAFSFLGFTAIIGAIPGILMGATVGVALAVITSPANPYKDATIDPLVEKENGELRINDEVEDEVIDMARLIQGLKYAPYSGTVDAKELKGLDYAKSDELQKEVKEFYSLFKEKFAKATNTSNVSYDHYPSLGTSSCSSITDHYEHYGNVLQSRTGEPKKADIAKLAEALKGTNDSHDYIKNFTFYKPQLMMVI